jgi:hypothetical protein
MNPVVVESLYVLMDLTGINFAPLICSMMKVKKTLYKTGGDIVILLYSRSIDL